jgi:cephalosporin hydroxylase
MKEFIDKYNLKLEGFFRGESNLHGWNSDVPVLKSVIDDVKPKTIIEVGTWLGRSAVNMTKYARVHNEDVLCLCVDTYLASNESLWSENFVSNINQKFDYIYKQFCINISNENLLNNIVPFPSTSSSAAELLKKESVKADMVYIDAGHRYREVYADLEDYWDIATKVIVGDDYNNAWPEVVKAANDFAKSKKVAIKSVYEKYVIYK